MPLEGVIAAVGRSIVIYGPEKSKERFACANIEPDHDIIKYVNVERPPRFVLAQFLEDVRHVLGIPEWMLAVDSRKTRVIHNGACMQMIIHFMGPQAQKIEQDLGRLLATGRLDEPSVSTPGFDDPKRKKTLKYKVCSVEDPNDSSKKRKSQFGFRFKSKSTTLRSTWLLVVFSALLAML